MSGRAVEEALARCLSHAEGEGTTAGEMLGELGREGFPFAALLLSLPFLQPISLGPLNVIGGLTFAVIGWQMARGHAVPTLPERVLALRVHGPGWCRALRFFAKLMAFVRRFSRPRASGWVTGRRGEALVGWLVAVGGILLAVPMAALPLNNTLPAFMIVFACIGWLERDGLMVIVSLLWGLATIVYFALVGVALFAMATRMWEWLQGLLA